MTATQVLEETDFTESKGEIWDQEELPRGVRIGPQGTDGGKRSRHISPTSQFTPDQGHRIPGVTITKRQSLLSSLLSSGPGLTRQALGLDGKEGKRMENKPPTDT